jgi:hypothetical protein
MGELADRRGADAQQIQLAAGGVALEVAVQAPFPRRHGQPVPGQGVVIHADGLVTVGP